MEIHTLAGVDAGLAVIRKVVTVFPHQNMGQETGSGAATLDLGATVEMDAEEIPAGLDFDVNTDPEHDTVNDALEIPLAMPPEAPTDTPADTPTIDVPTIEVPDSPSDASDPLDLDLDIQLDDPIDPDDFKLDL